MLLSLFLPKTLIGVYIAQTCLHDGPLSGCICEPSDYISLPPHKSVLIGYPRGSFIMLAIFIVTPVGGKRLRKIPKISVAQLYMNADNAFKIVLTNCFRSAGTKLFDFENKNVIRQYSAIIRHTIK